MRLTNTIRKAFIASVMNDVPQIDYQEQWRKVVTEACVAEAPKEVQTLWNNPDTRTWMNDRYIWGCGTSVSIPASTGRPGVPASVKEQAKAIEDQYDAQYDAQGTVRYELSTKLDGIAYSCRTRKALVEMLPEFEKYLPTENQPTKNLPVANVVSEFVKAGWPKGKEA